MNAKNGSPLKQTITLNFSTKDNKYSWDGTFLEKDDKHFKILYSKSDEGCINDLLNILNSNYDRILKDLSVSEIPKVTIKVYPSLEAYHLGINRPNDPDWSIGSSRSASEVAITSPMNPGKSHNYQSITAAIVHEFTHCVSRTINPSIKHRWLHESVACYEANQVRVIKNGDYIPTLAELDKAMNTEVYSFGYAIVDFIVSKYGIDKIPLLIKQNGDTYKVLGLTTDEFEQGYKQFMLKDGF